MMGHSGLVMWHEGPEQTLYISVQDYVKLWDFYGVPNVRSHES